jgi:hypothetical protein
MIHDASDPYEACLALTTSIETLANEIYERGRLRALGNVPIKELFEKPEVGKIEYTKIIRPFGGYVPEPSPFKKDLRFRPQKEWRIALKPFDGGAVADEKMMVFAPRVRKIFKRISVGRSVRPDMDSLS